MCRLKFVDRDCCNDIFNFFNFILNGNRNISGVLLVAIFATDVVVHNCAFKPFCIV